MFLFETFPQYELEGGRNQPYGSTGCSKMMQSYLEILYFKYVMFFLRCKRKSK